MNAMHVYGRLDLLVKQRYIGQIVFDVDTNYMYTQFIKNYDICDLRCVIYCT
jgi:hypothetical protein